MSYDSTFAQIGDIVKSDQSVNPISTPSISSNTSMADNERSSNRDNELDRLRPLRGHLGYEDRNDNAENELDRLCPLQERLASERMSAPSCIRIPAHFGTFHFRNGMISMLPQFHGIENEKAYLHL